MTKKPTGYLECKEPLTDKEPEQLQEEWKESIFNQYKVRVELLNNYKREIYYKEINKDEDKH